MEAFTVADDETTASAAARAYVWRRFRERAWLYIGGAMMFGAALLYFWNEPNSQVFVGVFAVFLFFLVSYLPIFYFAFPHAARRMVRRAPSRSVTVGTDKIQIATNDASVGLAWDQFTGLWEYPDFVLLPLRYGYWWLPKRDIPATALDLIKRSLAPR